MHRSDRDARETARGASLETLAEVKLPADRDVPPPVSAPALRRSAAAGLHRHGLSPSPAADRARRAHDRASTSRPRRMCSKPCAISAGARGRGCLRQPRPRRGREPRRDTCSSCTPGASSRPARRTSSSLAPGHPYTRRLIDAIPDIAGSRLARGNPRARPATRSPARRLRLRASVRRACSRPARCRARLSSRSRPVTASRCFRARELERPLRSTACTGAQGRDAEPVAALLVGQRIKAFHGANQVLHEVSLELAAAGVPGARRRVGLGEDDARAGDHGPPPPAGGEIRLEGTSCCRPRRATRDKEVAAQPPVHLPESVQRAEPAPHGRRDRAACRSSTSSGCGAVRRPSAGRRRGWSAYRSRAASPPPTRTSCRAASASGWRSRAPSPVSRTC